MRQTDSRMPRAPWRIYGTPSWRVHHEKPRWPAVSPIIRSSPKGTQETAALRIQRESAHTRAFIAVGIQFFP